MALPVAAHLTKEQIEQMRDSCMKYGQSVPQKIVRNMSTKDNPGTLPINLYAHGERTATPLDFTNLTEDVARAVAHNHNLEDILYTAGEVVLLSSYARSGRTALYVLQRAIIASTKKTKFNLFRGDPFNPLVFTEECC